MLKLVRWLSSWPLWLLHVLGAALGWLTYALSPSYRSRLRANAARYRFQRFDVISQANGQAVTSVAALQRLPSPTQLVIERQGQRITGTVR